MWKSLAAAATCAAAALSGVIPPASAPPPAAPARHHDLSPPQLPGDPPDQGLPPDGTRAGTDPAEGGRCTDPTSSWLGLRWHTDLRWSFNADSVPTYLQGSDPLAAVRTAAENVARGTNDCGLPADLTVVQRYQGDTDRRAGVTSDGQCGERDNHNVVSFGSLPPGLLAMTCVWWETRGGERRAVEADIRVDSTPGTFFLDLPAECRTRWDLESIATHEFGHVLGLGHVSYAQHSALTMSDSIPECTVTYRTLGLGDYRGLSARYGNNRTKP